MRVIRGSVLQTPSRTQLEFNEDVVVTVDDDGIITSIEDATSVAGAAQLSTARTAGTLDELSEGTYLMPGMIDLHVHAPQWPQLGTGLDLPLEQWLFDHTFPLEARFSDADFATRVWDSMLPALLANGTTTAVYYSSIHEEATELLARACVTHGQRALVGRVAMDHPEGTPDWYRDSSATDGVAASARSMEVINGLGSTLVEPIVTPRFIPACSDALLEGLAELASATGTTVQTHCSESDWEHGYVLERFGKSDTAALADFALLAESTVLAHCDHVGDDDLALIRDGGSGIAHCPLSNSYFGNAVFPARRALDAGVHVGLGTDIAGGAHPGLLHQAAHAVTVSRMLEDGVDARLSADSRGVRESRLDVIATFWMATVGGGNVLGKPLGLIEVGRPFDAFAVDTSALGIWDEVDDTARIFEKIIRLGSAGDISHVWVSGNQVV